MLMAWYDAMSRCFGPCRWWPGETPFEIAVGAILTQNTAWRNVEKALQRLREAQALTPAGLARLSPAQLEEAVRPSGFFRVKAARLRHFLDFLASFPGWERDAADPSLPGPAALPTGELRQALLAVKGIGPETADCITLYALGRPSFVADAYTARILSRHGQLPPDVPYAEMRDFFMDVLPPDSALYNEYHALIVRTGHTYCKKTSPRCRECPLGGFLDHAVVP